jgi:MFS family permease
VSAPQPVGLAAAGAAFGHRNFRLFWAGGVISNTGRWFQTVALPIVIYQLTESAGWVGVAGFAQIAPLAAMGPVAGALADRHHRRTMLLVTQSLQALTALGLMVLWFSGVRSVAAYLAMSLLVGVVGGLNLPAWQAFVSELVPRELLFSAITLNSAQFNASRLFGPALAGVIIAAFGPGWAFTVNLVSYGAVLLALSLIQVPRTVVPATERLRPIREFVAAAGYARQRPGIRTAIATVSLIGFFGLSLQMLSVVMAEEVFLRGERGFGLLLSCVGLGAVCASPVVASMAGRVRRSRLQGAALMLYGTGIIGLSLAPVFWVALPAMFVMGAAHLTSASTLNTSIQVQVDEAVRAKVLSLYLSMLTLANPLGQLLIGGLIELTAPRLAFFVCGLSLLGIATVLVTTGALEGLDEQDSPYQPGSAAEVQPSTPLRPRQPDR